MPCIVVYRVPGPERARNFDSQAIISVSPYVYFDGEDELDSGRTDVPRLTKLEYFLTEGQELGNADGTIAKITNDRIMLTDANGYLLTLPLNHVPEIDPEEKRRAAEAARQAAMQKAAQAAGAHSARPSRYGQTPRRSELCKASAPTGEPAPRCTPLRQFQTA